MLRCSMDSVCCIAPIPEVTTVLISRDEIRSVPLSQVMQEARQLQADSVHHLFHLAVTWFRTAVAHVMHPREVTGSHRVRTH